MKNSFKKFMSFLVIVVLSIIFISTMAFANTESPPYETPTIYGRKYSFISYVGDRQSTVEAMGLVKTDGGNVPTGYMGTNARLYNPSGNLVASSGTVYNPSSTSGFWVYSSQISTAGQYYAHNTGSFYNGNGYNTYIGYKSPILMFSGAKSSDITSESIDEADKLIEELMLKTEYAVNDNGETYGSALSAYTIGVEPDLISAIGTNGVKGYVRADELSPKVSTIEEALEQMDNNGDVRIIHLYDVDGVTMLGEFELITNYELVTDAE